MAKTLSEMVLEILEGKEISELQRRYYLVVKGIVAKKVRRYFSKADYKEWEEITQDITQDFFLWLLREDKKKNFSKRKHRLTAGYLLRKINNLVIDYLRRIDTLSKHIPYSLDTKIKDSKGNEDEVLTYGDTVPSEDKNLEKSDLLAIARAFLKLLEEKLNEEQIKTLCHLIFREKYSVDCFLEGLTPSTKYKRVERIKKTLREIFKENPLTVEEWKTFVELMEIYCQNRFGKCE